MTNLARTPPAHRTGKAFRFLPGYRLGAGLVLLAAVVLSCYGQVRFGYPVGPGDDILRHLRNTILVRDHLYPAFGEAYPPGLYHLVVAVSKLGHLSLLQSLNLLACALLPLSSLAIFMLARQVFGPGVGILALGLYALVSLQPLQTYFDGSLPSLLASGTMMPLAFLALIRAGERGARRPLWVALAAALFSLIVFTHHLTTLVFCAVSLPWALAAAVPAWRRLRAPARASWLTLAALLLGLLGGGFLHWTIFRPARSLFDLYLTFSNSFPFIASVPHPVRQVWDVRSFSVRLGGPIFPAAVLGVFGMAMRVRVLRGAERRGALLLLIWFALYFVGATTTWSGEPERMGRDLAMPACILAAWATVWAFDLLRRRRPVLGYAFLVAVGLLSLHGFARRIEKQTRYSPMVRFSGADELMYAHLLRSGLAPSTAVLEKGDYWQVMATCRGDADRFLQITRERPYAPGGAAGCYVVGWYRAGVWPGEYSDEALPRGYVDSPDLTRAKTFEDGNKRLFLMCRR